VYDTLQLSSSIHLIKPFKLWYGRYLFSGFFHEEIRKLHHRYGPVVRIQPDHISFDTSTSYKDIYGFQSSKPSFVKSAFYELASTVPKGTNPGILLDRDIERHGKTRRLLSHAFSPKALLEQEDLVRSFIDNLLEKFAVHGRSPEGLSATEWFGYFTFDVIGKLSLGTSFGCIADEKPHYWVKFVMEK
jgi:cytochrome P450